MQSLTRSLRISILALVALTLASLSGGSEAASAPHRLTTTLQPQPTPTPTRPILLTDPIPDPHQPGVQWFAPTGHTLRGAFLDYWTKYGGLAQFGYPLTEEFFETGGSDNKLYEVQYFERNRFEYHPENAGSEYEVLLGLLGRQLSEKKGFPYGWYPLFGHAADFSWFAGRFTKDPTLCDGCGCDNIHYTYHTTPRFIDTTKGTRIRPYGPTWEEARKWSRITDRSFLVVLGHLGASLEAEPERTQTCEKPAYLVERLQKNPAQ